MIPALFLAALQKTTVPIDVIQEPGSEIRFEAVVLLPKDLAPEDRAMLPVLAAAMQNATDDFPPTVISALTGGRPVNVEAMPDHLRISFGVAANAETAGLDLLSSILQRPLLREGAITKPPTGFYAGVLGQPCVTSKVPAEELKLLYGTVVRPERARIAVVGPASKEVAAKLSMRLTDWPIPPRVNPYRRRPKFETERPDGTFLVLQSPPIAYGSSDLPARLIAWAAVGVGKGSALFHVARETMGMSYRQEAFLVPTDAGLIPTIAIATDHPDPEGLKKGILEDIEGWSEVDIARAKGLLRSNAETGLPLSPLLFSLDGPPSAEAADRAFLAAYWRLRTGKPWNPLYWATDVSLDDVKKAAKESIEQARERQAP
ncbi:hypothetical protein BH11ARM2_BH11ARM2_14580 [soil metagenome]